jgi:hypothetical protein
MAAHLLSCDGISELVRGQEALFLTELEDQIEILDPARPSWSRYQPTNTTLRCSTLRASAAAAWPTTRRFTSATAGVMNLVPYQLDPALQALRQPRSAS